MSLYHEIYEHLLRQIESRVYLPGDKLPTEIELAQALGVSRPTVRTALLRLVSEGHLVRIKHKGTFVTTPKLANESTRFLAGYREELQKKGLEPHTQVLELRLMKAGDKVAQRLNISPGERVVFLKRLRWASNSSTEEPLVLTWVYLSYAKFPFLLEQDFEQKGLYQVLEENGTQVSTVSKELEIAALDGKSARLLDCKAGSPAHFISSLGKDKNGNPVEYAESLYPAQRNKFLITIAR